MDSLLSYRKGRVVANSWKVNTKGDGRFYQIELEAKDVLAATFLEELRRASGLLGSEVDGDTVADGGRFVWFNSGLQKAVRHNNCSVSTHGEHFRAILVIARLWRSASAMTRLTFSCALEWNPFTFCAYAIFVSSHMPVWECRSLSFQSFCKFRNLVAEAAGPLSEVTKVGWRHCQDGKQQHQVGEIEQAWTYTYLCIPAQGNDGSSGLQERKRFPDQLFGI